MEIWEGRRPGTEGALRDWPIDRADSSHDMCYTSSAFSSHPCVYTFVLVLTLASILS